MYIRIASGIVPLVLISAGCGSGAGPAADLPAEYADQPAVIACGQHLQRVSDISGRLFYEVQHGDRVFRLRNHRVGEVEVGLQIARGEVMRPLASEFVRTDDVSGDFNVSFDGWLLRAVDCPQLAQDTYFVARFDQIGREPSR